jgi:hypothetical protein
VHGGASVAGAEGVVLNAAKLREEKEKEKEKGGVKKVMWKGKTTVSARKTAVRVEKEKEKEKLKEKNDNSVFLKERDVVREGTVVEKEWGSGSVGVGGSEKVLKEENTEGKKMVREEKNAEGEGPDSGSSSGSGGEKNAEGAYMEVEVVMDMEVAEVEVDGEVEVEGGGD